VLFRPDTLDFIKQVKTVPLLLEKHLSKDKQISLPIYCNLQDALVAGSKFSSRPKVYFKGQSEIVVIGPPPESKIPKEVEHGDIISGYVIFRNLEEGENVPDTVPKKGLAKPLGGFFIEYVVGPSTSSPKKAAPSFPHEENKSAQENYELSLKQHAADYISSLVTKKN